jgi:hypothetical protein
MEGSAMEDLHDEYTLSNDCSKSFSELLPIIFAEKDPR